EILLKNGSDPTVSIGGILPSIGGNVRIGGPDCFVCEACEYTNSFLSFFPKIALILNIEEDHLDFFKDIHDIRNSFHRFASLVPEDGAVIIGNDIPEKETVASGLSCPVITFGKEDGADYFPADVRTDGEGLTHFSLLRKKEGGEAPGKDDGFVLKVPGFHNVLNACAAIAAADLLKVPRDVTKAALASYGGTDRRFEEKGMMNGVRIIDDYAHHPSEIRATLAAARQKTSSKLWVIFQPHTYSRTKAFLPEFAEALSLADAVILADIYAAREKDDLGISSENIAELLRKKNIECYYIPSFEEIENFVKENCAPGEMLITMGAGDVVNIANDLTSG
nr:UDP-N-acetylmuramate--L-alanine ligase [Lachnospiraceae bacterium]